MLGTILPTTVLISRPFEDANAVKRAVLAQFPSVDVIVAPALKIKNVPFEAPEGDFDALVLTSKHAVEAAARIAPNATALCVGDATAKSARAHGLKAISAQGAAQDLFELARDSDVTKLLYLHGAHVHTDLAGALTNAGLEAKSRVVYRQDACAFSAEVRDRVAKLKSLVVPVYSARSAQIVSENLNGFGGQIVLVAISDAAQQGWSGPDPKTTIIAQAPNSKAMLTAIASQLT